MNLLDFNIKIDGTKPEFSFYKKSASRDIFIHYNSALPTSMKQNTISNELNRIQKRCSKPETFNKAKQEFQHKLQRNNYPRNFINKCNPQKKRINQFENRNQTQNQNHNNRTYYFQFPFISDNIQNKIKRIFRNENLNVRLYDRKHTLRNALKNINPQESQCNKQSCSINDSQLCYKKSSVYQLKCQLCHKIYIDSTIRYLHDHIQEHLTSNLSSVFQHKQQCKSKFNTKIICIEKDKVNLRFKEAIKIKQLNPEINSKEELTNLWSIIY